MVAYFIKNPDRNSLKAVVFDFDGVIVESVALKDLVFQEIFGRFGTAGQNALNFHRENSGASRVDKFAYLLTLINKTKNPISLKELCDEFASLVIDKVITCPYVSGALEFVVFVKEKYPVFLASITPHNELDYILNKRGIAELFDGYYGTTQSKSHIINALLQSKGLQPHEIILIGDTLQDYKAANSCGIGFIGFRNHLAFPEDTLVFDDFKAMTRWFST